MSDSQIPGAQAYMAAVRTLLDDIVRTQAEAIDQAVSACVRSIQADGMIYLFGTGHSHMLTEEGHYRAGGLAPICPILSEELMLHKSAIDSSQIERTSGISQALLEHYHPTANDVLFVFANSGVNIGPVEMALAGKEVGMPVIVILSRAYAERVPVNTLGKKLYDVADIVLDNRGIAGDAIVPIGETGLRVGPTSTIAGAFILNAIFTEVTVRLEQRGAFIPAYISSNMPGAAEHNQKLLDRYRARNPHL
ncbi:MAG: SIS domain-containing protein [Taibaiella sp.]|nr:SIS domain-containing protein [Taibaiella sp.]